jgi:glutamate--cysteine ligase
MEKFGVLEDTRTPVPYHGDRGILRILEFLVTTHGWTPESEHAGGPIVALSRGDSSITLEPGGQLELSGGKSETIHQVAAELREHMAELAPISRKLGVRWLGVGFQPLARREDFEWVPKQRYAIMRSYLPTRGQHAIDMMLRTCTVQANFDYASEEDAIRKMRVALALAPVTMAMFANSPFREGRLAGGLDFRGRVWLDVDPDRTGLVPSLWKPGAGFEDYVEWALDVPMILFKREGRIIVNTGQTFRDFLAHGYDGHHATAGDWLVHLNSLFPDVRLKKTIEVRVADAQGTDLGAALPALFAGLLYDATALDDAQALVADWTCREVSELRATVWRAGLRTLWRGAPLLRVAERVLEIAEHGLERRSRYDESAGSDERIFLAGLRSLVSAGRSPGDLLLSGLERKTVPADVILDRTALRLV